MSDIQKFTEKSLDRDYLTWYQSCQRGISAPIFDYNDLRAEERFFSKTIGIYDEMYNNMRVSDIENGNVPAHVNFQEYITRDKFFYEETDRCYLYPIADNFVAVLIGCLKDNKLLKNTATDLKDEPRLTAHIRRIIQFFVIPSQVYNRSQACDIEIAMHKV